MKCGEFVELSIVYLLLTCCITILLHFIKWKLSRQHLYELAAKIPSCDGMKSVPIIGHALYFIGNSEKFIQNGRRFFKNPSPPRTVWLGYRLFFAINRPEDMEVILNSPNCLTKDDLYRMTVPLAGNGLLSLSIPQWRRHRKVIMPTFNQKILDSFVEVFVKQAEIFVRQLETKTGELINFYEYATKYGLDTVCETAMGVSINAQTTKSNIEHAIIQSMDITMVRMLNVPYHFDWIFNLTKLSRDDKKNVTLFRKFILEVIERKVADYRKNVDNQNNVINVGDDRKRVAFLELLIELSENGENWSIEELRAEVSTFMIGGSDTGATIVSFAMLLLAIHPEIQQKCYEEVMEVVGPNRQLDSTDLSKLVYLEKVIKETMRMFPVAPTIIRKVDEDIEVGGYTLPKGAGVVLSIMTIHYSKLYYKDPYEFNPDRFSPEENAKRHKFAYLPFSGGPRNCVDFRFCKMMKCGEFVELSLSYILLTCCITISFYFIKWKLSRQHLYELAAKIPSCNEMKSMPIIGHALYFFGDTEKILRNARRFSEQPSPPRTVWLGHRLFFTINRPEDMEVILNSPKCLSKDDLYRMTVPLGGDGLFSLPVPQWKRHRKVIMPTFNQKILDTFVEVFANQAEIFVRQLETKTGELIDFLEYASKYGLDTVCETAMGVSINAQTTKSNIEHAIIQGMDIMMVRMFNVPYHYDWIFNLTKLSRDDKKYVMLFRKFILEVIERKVADYKKNVANQNNIVNVGDDKKRMAFLELLIELSENGENWSIEELRSEVSTFMIAGSDTSATISSFAILLLAMHPEIQQKCYEEVIEVLGHDRQLNYTDLSKFVYLEKVIKETMRLFPVGPLIVRKVDEDMEVGGYTLPKGAGLVLCIMAIHYSELYYKDPWKFDPERFSPEENAKRHKYAYLPFSGGPRNCVGLKYGMMSLKTLLAVTLRKYRAETVYRDVKEIKIKQSLVIKAVEGFPIKLFPRS